MPHHLEAAPAEDAIRGAGLRVTESRRAVYAALGIRPHASADEVYGAVAASLPATSLQSVYNALSDFADAGIVRLIEPAGHRRRYELRVDDNHHHVVCTGCGAIADVDCSVGHAPCLTPSESHGFAIHTAEVTYWGLCADCAREPASADAAPASADAAPAPAPAG